MANQYSKFIKYGDNVITYTKADFEVVIRKDELIDYYITQNKSKKDTCKYFRLTNANLSNCLYYFNIKKSDQLSAEINKQTKLLKYGDAHYNNRSKYKETSLKKYGVDNIFKKGDLMADYREQKLGVRFAACDPMIKERIVITRKERYTNTEMVTKRKITNLERYGVEFPMQIDFVKEHFKNTREERCGKIFKTRKLHGTVNTSKYEEEFYLWACANFDKEDIFRNYKTSIYPYHCDFYIKSLDYYIELNLYWTHGGHPYDANNADDIKKIEQYDKLKQEHPLYAAAIDVWTNRDPQKLKVATNNKLNYLTAYNKADIEKIKEKIKYAKKHRD